MTREVYLGNGETIQPKINQNVINFLDLDKLEEILKKNPNKEIYVGTEKDWYWTATKINLKEYKKEIKNDK